MKRKCFLFLLAASLLLAAGCAREDFPLAQPPPAPETAPAEMVPAETGYLHPEKYTVNKTVSLDTQPLVSSLLSVPVTRVDGIDGYYFSWLRDQQAQIDALDAQALEVKRSGLSAVFHAYDMDSNYYVMRNDPLAFSVMRDFFQDTGGAHPSMTLLAETFNPDTGTLLTLDQVFNVSEEVYYPAIRDIVLRQIEESGRYDVYFEGFQDTLMSVFDPKNFYLSDDALTVFWQAYDIAPYVAGVQRFTIDFKEIGDFLDPKWMT